MQRPESKSLSGALYLLNHSYRFISIPNWTLHDFANTKSDESKLKVPSVQ